ncbi:hypothetical protein MNBD_GAMMA13-1267 [hydrothermal vent metagenome]|uniref:GYF domain-containing protein n=1 Tax=hydrothermal vent metagenome TaxID=652676 RepID=A0A3B0Y011_9ZZZZ
MQHTLWYTRRASVERGPYPENQISRYILLGRIGEQDELRPENGHWQPLLAYPDLIPAVMKLPTSDENRQKLLIARMREDERQPGDRRERRPRPPDEVLERRSGEERRRLEQDQVSSRTPTKLNLYRYSLAVAVMVLIGFSVSVLLQELEPEQPPPDCAAPVGASSPAVSMKSCL